MGIECFIRPGPLEAESEIREPELGFLSVSQSRWQYLSQMFKTQELHERVNEKVNKFENKLYGVGEAQEIWKVPGLTL